MVDSVMEKFNQVLSPEGWSLCGVYTYEKNHDGINAIITLSDCGMYINHPAYGHYGVADMFLEWQAEMRIKSREMRLNVEKEVLAIGIPFSPNHNFRTLSENETLKSQNDAIRKKYRLAAKERKKILEYYSLGVD